MSGMENIIKSVDKTMKQRVKAGRAAAASAGKREKDFKGVCAVKLMLNPKSFTQSAENLLALSFRVKSMEAKIKNDENGLPVVDTVRSVSAAAPSTKQSIVSFSMKDWKGMVKTFGVQESDCVPNRKQGGGKRETVARGAGGDDGEGEYKEDDGDDE